jgi:hypothetical protein
MSFGGGRGAENPSAIEDATLRGYWFYPILERIREFEESADVFGVLPCLAAPDSPDWIVKLAWSQMIKHREGAGIVRLERIGARQVGAMIGAKASICERMANGNVWFSKLPLKRQDKFVEIFGEESVALAKVIWSEFKETLLPEFRVVRQFASDLTMLQASWEQIQYHQGIVSGLRFMNEIRDACRKTNKRAEDGKKRDLVFLFVLEHCELIDVARKDLQWSDLVTGFEESIYGRHIEIDEQTFTKILQRSDLGIGIVGRPKK